MDVKKMWRYNRQKMKPRDPLALYRDLGLIDEAWSMRPEHVEVFNRLSQLAATPRLFIAPRGER